MKLFFKKSLFSRDIEGPVNEKTGRGKPLCVMDDMVFKAMLTSDTEDSREALRSLLSACTRRDVSKVRVMNNDLVPAHLEAKTPRLDVHVTFNDGEVADLEMQMDRSSDDIKVRAATYSAMLQSNQPRRGKFYKEAKRVYQIFFLNFIMFPQSEKLPRRYGLREEMEHDLLTDAVEIIFYELPRLEQRVVDYLEGRSGSEVLRPDEKWCIFMKYRHEERALPLIEELCEKEAGIMRAERTVTKLSREEKKFWRDYARYKDEVDAAFAYRRAFAEGETKNTLEIARKLKSRGRPLAEIAEDTGLSPEAIEQL